MEPAGLKVISSAISKDAQGFSRNGTIYLTICGSTQVRDPTAAQFLAVKQHLIKWPTRKSIWRPMIHNCSSNAFLA